MYKIHFDSLAKMYGDSRASDYCFKAEINGVENIYIAEVRDFLLENLFLHRDINDFDLLVRKRVVTYYVMDEQIELYERMFIEIEEVIQELNNKILH
jgi:hypothetical protein